MEVTLFHRPGLDDQPPNEILVCACPPNDVVWDICQEFYSINQHPNLGDGDECPTNGCPGILRWADSEELAEIAESNAEDAVPGD